MRGALLAALLIAATCLYPRPLGIEAAHLLPVGFSHQPLAASVQSADVKAAVERTSRLASEIKDAAYPELRGAEIEVRPFESRSDYFRARFAFGRYFMGRRMRYVLFVNAGVYTRQAPDAGVRAIIAHEMAHVLYYRRRNRLRLLGLVRLASKGFTARFERWADLQAIARGYGEGLKSYRQWLYRNVPASRIEEKKRDYFSPEEIDAIQAAVRERPELLPYWLKHVPGNLGEILAATNSQRKD